MKSKQLSIISRRPDLSAYTFFLDRQIDGPELVKVLVDSGMTIKRHGDTFDADVDDDVWIRGVAERLWISITADKHIDHDYLDIICETKAKLIILTDNQSGYPQWEASIIASQNAFLRALSAFHGPMVIRLSRQGSITRVRDHIEVHARQQKIKTAKIIREKRK